MQLVKSKDGDSLLLRTITGAGVTTIGVSPNGRYTQPRTIFGDGSIVEHESVNEWWSWLTTLPMTFGSVTCLRTSPPAGGDSIESVWMLSNHSAVGGTGGAPSR